MTHSTRILAGVLLLAAVTGFTSAQKENPVAKAAAVVVNDANAGRPIVKGQLLVTLHKGLTADDLKPIFERLEVKYEVVGRIPSANCYVLSTNHARLPEIKQRLENHPYVASSGFNGVTPSRKKVTNDPVFKKPNEMPEDKDNWNLYRIKAPDAWDITTGGTVVAVVDTGVVMKHEELDGRTTQPFSFATNSTTFQEGVKKLRTGPKRYIDEDPRNHGTHVSVTIGGKADNNAGTVGIAPGSMIMPIQVLIYRDSFPDEGAGDLLGYDEDILAGLARAMDRGATAINMSLGGIDMTIGDRWKKAQNSDERDTLAAQLLAQANEKIKVYAPILDRAYRSGVIVVTAAGNESLPADFDGYALSRRVIAVAATTRDDERADFSNYGPYTTVSAPGNEIYSAFADPGKPYKYLSGTSMAAPHASGVVSLMQTLDPGLKLPDVATILINTGKVLETDYPIGPLLNARAALEETRRRRDLGIREPEMPPLLEMPGINPALPDLPDDGIVALLGQPEPWNNPNIRRILRLWLAFANAPVPAGGNPNIRWFFNLNGQVVNNQTVVTTPRPVWGQFNYRYLWENAGVLNSTNMGTLYEFTAGTLKSKKFDPAPARVPEKFRPGPKDPQPKPGGMPLDPGLGKTKWSGTNGKGDKVDFDFDGKTVTVKRDGKTTRYKPFINPYVHPMTLDLRPEDGGNPIRCLLQMTDLNDFLLRTDFTSVRPKTLSPKDPGNFKLSRSDLPLLAKGGRGFGDGDGKLVDPRFADAEICDGTSGDAGKVGKEAGSAGSAGPRTAIASTKVNKDVPPVIGHAWMVREFTDGPALSAYIGKVAKDPRFTTKTFDSGMAGFIVVSRDIGADHIKDTNEVYAKVGKAFEQSSHLHMFIYRERFLVTYSLWEGKRGHDFKDESKKIEENTKKLIDSRFPKE